MGMVAAVKMGDALGHAGLGTMPLLTGFVLVVFVVGILIPQIIPKWALFAPVFVPLFMQLGVAPEAVLAAYRVGDSPSNVINPLMPYFALIVTFVQRYQKDAGVGHRHRAHAALRGRADRGRGRCCSSSGTAGPSVRAGLIAMSVPATPGEASKVDNRRSCSSSCSGSGRPTSPAASRRRRSS